MLGLQVGTPGDREFEFLAGALEDFHRFGVGQALEGFLDYVGQPVNDRVVDPLGEELHVGRTLLEHLGKHGLEQVFGQRRVVVDVGKGDLRLDHPELGQVPGGVGVLGAEGRAEGVDVLQGQAVALHVQLAGYGEEGLLAEEVLAEVHRLVAVDEFQGGDPEQLARAFAVRGGDDGRVHPLEASALQETVHGHGDGVAHPGDGAEGVGARAQVGNGAQVFEGVPLLGDRVVLRVVHPAEHFHALGLNLPVLALAAGLDQGAADANGAAGADLEDLRFVVRSAPSATACTESMVEPSLT